MRWRHGAEGEGDGGGGRGGRGRGLAGVDGAEVGGVHVRGVRVLAQVGNAPVCTIVALVEWRDREGGEANLLR